MIGDFLKTVGMLILCCLEKLNVRDVKNRLKIIVSYKPAVVPY